MKGFMRKVQLVGNRSYSVSLPKTWILKNKIDINRSVFISENMNNLIISPDFFNNYSEKIEIDITDIKLIKNIILLCYTKGITELILKFSNKEQYLKSKGSLTEILSTTEGFKITEEIHNLVKISFFYEKFEIKIKTILRRMMSLTNDMIECIINKNTNTKRILENELDSLYHLSKRILYLSAVDSEVKIKNDLEDLEEIFLWRSIFKRIEHLGDVFEIIGYFKANQDEIVKKILKDLYDFSFFNKNITIEQIESLKNLNFEDKHINRIRNLCVDILEDLMLIELNKKHLKS